MSFIFDRFNIHSNITFKIHQIPIRILPTNLLRVIFCLHHAVRIWAMHVFMNYFLQISWIWKMTEEWILSSTHPITIRHLSVDVLVTDNHWLTEIATENTFHTLILWTKLHYCIGWILYLYCSNNDLESSCDEFEKTLQDLWKSF